VKATNVIELIINGKIVEKTESKGLMRVQLSVHTESGLSINERKIHNVPAIPKAITFGEMKEKVNYFIYEACISNIPYKKENGILSCYNFLKSRYDLSNFTMKQVSELRFIEMEEEVEDGEILIPFVKSSKTFKMICKKKDDEDGM